MEAYGAILVTASVLKSSGTVMPLWVAAPKRILNWIMDTSYSTVLTEGMFSKSSNAEVVASTSPRSLAILSLIFFLISNLSFQIAFTPSAVSPLIAYVRNMIMSFSVLSVAFVMSCVATKNRSASSLLTLLKSSLSSGNVNSFEFSTGASTLVTTRLPV